MFQARHKGNVRKNNWSVSTLQNLGFLPWPSPPTVKKYLVSNIFLFTVFSGSILK